MESRENNERKRLKKAQERLKQLKGFYIHLTIYLAVNTILLLMKVIGNAYYGESFMGPVWHFSTFSTWFFWGIGLFFHGLKVFNRTTLFSKNWEERQIQKYLEQDRREAEKYGNHGR